MFKHFVQNTTQTERILMGALALSLILFWGVVLTNHSLWGMTTPCGG